MIERRFTPNNNEPVIRMLSKEFGKCNKGRNRILLGAVILCIVTLTMVFGISYGKVQAECLKEVREAGTMVSTYIEDADQTQYEKVRSLTYVNKAGRRVVAGRAVLGEQLACELQWLDGSAWEKMIKPAYTEICGRYPKKKQEIMLSKKALNNLNISEPKMGMKITLNVTVGLFKTVQEDFQLCGWYTDFIDEAGHIAGGYISMKKLQEWGYDIEEKSDILICQSDSMDWRETEERLYQDIPMKNSSQIISASNTYNYNAVNQLTGSYGMATLGAVIILSGMFFLIYNVMQISMMRDIRQMSLLNIIGATKRQIRKIYYRQILKILSFGTLFGGIISIIILQIIIPKILGNQYLSRFGGAEGFVVLRLDILGISILFVVIVTMSVATRVIYQVVNYSCIESMNYTGLKKRYIKKCKKVRKSQRSVSKELWYLAWQNLTRYRGRFLLTIFSLFLGLEAFLGVVVIASGSNYVHVIEKRPDFLIAGQFSKWGQDMGYGNEYKARDLGEDFMKTEGDCFPLLFGNEYDEFSPISLEARENLLSIAGVDKRNSYVMEGAYMISSTSRKGILPLESEGESLDNSDIQRKEAGYDSENDMVESAYANVIQILNDDEIVKLKEYVEKYNLSVDIDKLENGTGVMILHDHRLSPAQEKQAEKSIGEPVYFKSLFKIEDQILWNQKSAEEKEISEKNGEFVRKQSERFVLCGYLDNQAEGFPDIQQTWHGSQGGIYYLISEKGFRELPTEKKTLYMELNVDQNREPNIKREIQKIVSQENQKRAQMAGTGLNDEMGEAGIFFISKSDMLLESSNYIHGNNLILGSISVVLLFAGFTNYFNVMITGILSRRKEMEIMHNIGMTKKQEQRMLLIEGEYYCIIVVLMIASLGNILLKLISMYMEKKISNFVFSYPTGWLIVLIGGLTAICLMLPGVMYRRK